MQARLAQSSAALLANARLSLEVLLANSYFALRGLDIQTDVYRRAVANYASPSRSPSYAYEAPLRPGWTWPGPRPSWHLLRLC